jgi:hypothetical protein
MSALDGLELRKADLTRALAETRRALKKAKVAARAVACAWRLDEELRNAVLSVYVLSGYDLEPAAACLLAHGRRRRWPALTTLRARTLVEDIFLNADLAELVAVGGVCAPNESAAMRAASKVIEEWKLVAWARRQNSERGVAPTTDDVLQRLVSNRCADGHHDPQGRGTAADAAARIWATRFRRRWCGRFGSITIADEPPAADMRAKAPLRCRISSSYRAVSCTYHC